MPLQIATVGLSTFSITRLNGSVSPVVEQLLAQLDDGVELGEEVGHCLGRQPLERVDQLADGLDLGLHVHRDEDVELVLDVGDEIEHGQAVPLEVLGEARRLGDRRRPSC